MAINASNAQRSEVYSNLYLSDKNIGYFQKLEMRCFLPDDHYKSQKSPRWRNFFVFFKTFLEVFSVISNKCLKCVVTYQVPPAQDKEKIPSVKINSTPVMKNRITFESWLFVTNGVSVIGNIKNLHITDETNYGMWVFLGNQIRFIRQ